MEYDAVDGEYLMTLMCLCDVVTLSGPDRTKFSAPAGAMEDPSGANGDTDAVI